MGGFSELTHRAASALKSRRGRDVLMFLIFLAISTILWIVLSLNQEEQIDVRMPVRVTNVPDSVTLVSQVPDGLTVNIRAQGTQALKLLVGRPPMVNIDFRSHNTGRAIYLNNAELKTVIRNAAGGAQISLVLPDTFSVLYTTHPGFKLPVTIDAAVSVSPRCALISRPHAIPDSVRVFSLGSHLSDSIRSIKTEFLRLENLDKSVAVKTRLIAPRGCRVIPDSIDVVVDVEPLIIKSRSVVIEPINVPTNIKLITFPAQIEVNYMVPMSAYTQSDPHFRVVADYRTIDLDAHTSRMRLRLVDVPENLRNVYLGTDSAEYIIERL